MKHNLDNDIELVSNDSWTAFEQQLASTLAVRAEGAASPAVSADVPSDAQPLAEQRHHSPRFARAALVAVAAAVIAVAAIGIFQLSGSVDESETVVATSPAAAEPTVSQDQPSAAEVGPPTGEAFDYIAAWAAMPSRTARPFQSAEEITPFVVSARDEFPQFGFVAVIGTVTAVEPGRSVNGGGKSVRLTVNVVETLAPQPNDQPTQMTVGQVIGPLSIDTVRADYLSLDRVMLVLFKSPVFDYDPNLFGILEDGRIMGVIDENDNVTFPLLPRRDQLAPEGGIALDRLRAPDPN